MATSPEAKRLRTDVVVLDYADLTAGKDLTADIRKAYGPGGLGILYVKNVPGMQEARKALLPLSRILALLPEDVLSKYENEKAFYGVGWSRGKEKFKGKPDVAKGSFYANPCWDDPSGGDADVLEKFPVAMPNVWPKEVPELEDAMKKMGRLVYETSKHIVRQVDKLVAESKPSHATMLFDRTYTESKFVVTRLLHYYGVTASDDLGEWCGWHNDNSTITGLVPAMWFEEDSGKEVSPKPGAGLFVEGRSGETINVASPPDCLGFQIGEAAQILSGGVVHATPHMVKGYVSPPGEPKISRETYACFMQPQWDGELRPPSGSTLQDIFQGRDESTLIPPLSSRLKEVPIMFGDILQQSAAVYYERNNPSDDK